MSLPRDARLSPVRACRALCPQVVFALNKGCDGRGAHRRFLRRCKTATSYAGAAPPPRSHRGKGSSDPSGGPSAVLAKLPRYPHRVAIVGFDVIGVTTEVKRGDLGRWSPPGGWADVNRSLRSTRRGRRRSEVYRARASLFVRYSIFVRYSMGCHRLA